MGARIKNVTFKAALGMALFGIGSIGYFLAPAAVWERLLAIAAGAMLIVALPPLKHGRTPRRGYARQARA